MIWPFKRKKQLVITFTKNATGQQIATAVKMSKGINAGNAMATLDRLSFDIRGGIVKRCQAKGFTSKDSITRTFQGKLTLDDVL